MLYQLYNELLEMYFHEHNCLLDAKRKKLNTKYNPINLIQMIIQLGLKKKNCVIQLQKEMRGREKPADILSIPRLQCDEEGVKECKEIKLLTANKLLTRLPGLLAQKYRNNSYKLKSKIIQTLYLLYQHNKITKNVYNTLIKSLQ